MVPDFKYEITTGCGEKPIVCLVPYRLLLLVYADSDIPRTKATPNPSKKGQPLFNHSATAMGSTAKMIRSFQKTAFSPHECSFPEGK